MMQPLLQIEGLNFQYTDAKSLFENLNIMIENPCCIGLLGKNGVGKTSLLKLITGLISPSRGTIQICGKRVRSHKDAKDCIFVPENAKLFLFSPTPRKELFRIIKNDELVTELLNKYRMNEYADRKLYHLSEGQRRLVALLTAFQLNKRVILLDEPTIGLDSQGRTILVELMMDSVKKGRICIVSTNDQRLFPHFEEIIVLSERGDHERGKPLDILFRLEDFLGVIPNQIPQLINELEKKAGLILPKMITAKQFNQYIAIGGK